MDSFTCLQSMVTFGMRDMFICSSDYNSLFKVMLRCVITVLVRSHVLTIAKLECKMRGQLPFLGIQRSSLLPPTDRGFACIVRINQVYGSVVE